jgi:hypothetical protein
MARHEQQKKDPKNGCMPPPYADGGLMATYFMLEKAATALLTYSQTMELNIE